MSLGPLEPSAGLKSRVLAVATGRQAPRRGVLSRVFWAAAAIVLVALIFNSLTTVDYERVELAGADPSPSAQGFVLWRERQVKIRATGLARLPADKVYELWRIRDGKVLRAGEYTLDESGNLRGEHVMHEPFAKGDAFAVTIEPVGGVDGPTGKMPLTPRK